DSSQVDPENGIPKPRNEDSRNHRLRVGKAPNKCSQAHVKRYRDGDYAQRAPSAESSPEAMGRVVDPADVDRTPPGEANGDDEHDVKERVAQEERHRRQVRERARPMERLQRERGSGEAEE